MSQPAKKPTRTDKPNAKPKGAKPAKRYRADPFHQAPARPAQGAQALSLADDQPEPERIDRVGLETVRPDPWQGRRPLPAAIRQQFQSGEIGAEQAVLAWVQLAEQEPAEAARLEPYRTLARSFGEHEQINPSSVVRLPPTPDSAIVYQIETGERRFWAAWLAVVELGAKDRTLKVVIRDRFDPVRQAEENSTQAPLSAIEMARTVARTYLALMGVDPSGDDAPGSLAFYRRALLPASELTSGAMTYTPRGIWPEVEKALGVGHRHLERLLVLLELPDPVIDAADAFAISERVLRTLKESGAAPDRQLQVVQAAGLYQLSSPYVRRLCQAADFNAELTAIVGELPQAELDEPDADGAQPKAARSGRKKRATPATRAAGAQFADRLLQLRRTVVRYAKGANESQSAAVSRLTSDALRLQPEEVADMLAILRPLVSTLEQLTRSRKTG